MPVRFTCFQCHQLLSVSRRKIGQAIDCPRCGAASIVPEPNGAANGHDARQDDEGDARLDAGFDDVDELLAQPVLPPPATAAATAAQRAPGGPAPAPPTAGWSMSPPPPGPVSPTIAALPTAPTGETALDADNMLLVSRRVVYVQALLFCVVAGVAFAAGFFMGRGQPPPLETGTVARPQPKAEPPFTVRGTVSVSNSADSGSPDSSALVIALPDEPPLRKLSPHGLQPQDAAAGFDAAAAAIHEAGGDCTRADQNGTFQFVVPAPGSYHLLIVSRHAARPSEQRINRTHLTEMSRYFENPAGIVGDLQYRWSQEMFTRTSAPLSQTFETAKN